MTRRPYAKCLKDSVAAVSCAGRPKPASTWSATASSASRSAGRNMCWSGCRASSAGRSSAANPFARGADRARFAEFYAELDARDGRARRPRNRSCVGPIAYTGQAALQRDIDNFKAALHRREGRGGVPAGGGAGERHPRPQERILQDARRSCRGRHRRGDAHRIQDDRRCRVPGAARRRARRRHLRPHGAAREPSRNTANGSGARSRSINHALDGIPEDDVRYHVCWGSWPGPHTTDVPLARTSSISS